MGRVTGHVYLVPGSREHKDPAKRGDPRYERKAGPAFYMSYRYPSGKQERKLIGDVWKRKSRPPAGHFTRRMAEDVLAERLSEIRRDEVPDPGRQSGRTFGEAVDEWIRYGREEKDLETTTLRDYESAGNLFKREFGADTPIEAITEDPIAAYRSKMLTTPLVNRGNKKPKSGEPVKLSMMSRRSAQKHLVLLGGVFKRAKRNKWISQDPTAEVEPISVKRSGDFNVLSIDQLERVVSACPDETLSAAILTAAYAGLRAGEVRALRIRDLDFPLATIHVRTNQPAGGEEKAPKSGLVRSVPMMDDVARVLLAVIDRDHYTGPDNRVFPNEVGGMLAEDSLRDALYEAMEVAGIDRKSFPAREGFVFHDLRHVFGTLGARIWPLSDLMAYMGHSDIKTTMRYVHFVPKTGAAQEFTRAVERLRQAADPFENQATETSEPEEIHVPRHVPNRPVVSETEKT